MVCANRTTLVIAHRLSTVVNADEIIVLRDGLIAERGTHSGCCSHATGLYAQMWNRQREATEAEELRAAPPTIPMASSSAACRPPSRVGQGPVFPCNHARRMSLRNVAGFECHR